jgi:ADP-ribose diphosphatase
MPKKPDILAVSTVARSRLFHIEQVDLQFSNGAKRKFERLRSGATGSVLMVPVDDDELVLIREYAVGTERYELGFPKGAIDQGESPVEAAARELREEIGMAGSELTVLRRYVASPAYFNRPTWIVLAKQLIADPLPGDEPEEIEQLRWPLARMWELLDRDDFADGCNQLALYMLGHVLNITPPEFRLND